uniref:FERM domain containing 4Bb n=1 Tax=Cyprinus carpio TaxID=7962 RepID=A0A8C2DTH6_CYPCA
MAWGLVYGVEALLLWSGTFIWQIVVWMIRRCYLQRMRSCQQCLQTCFYLSDVYQMTEGRLCQVQLLDDRKLELLVQPKLLSRELLDLVSSHFNLKEKEYFGFTYVDDIGQCKWLQLDRRVLEHDFSKKSGPIALQFLVRFYIETISLLKEHTTVELFFLNAKSAIYNGDIEVESELVFKLAAHALQCICVDFSDENTRADLKNLPALPTKVLQEHPSLAYCEERVIEHHKLLKGLSRGQAIVQYLTLVESLPTYGVHYYEVKDKQGIPWWLGISYKGIGQYDHQDKVKPRKLFQWKQLENLYFREKKFAVEVNDPHSSLCDSLPLDDGNDINYETTISSLLILDQEVQGPGHYYTPREVFSAQSSPCKTLPRMPKDPRSLPQTPVMPRNAYSSSQLRSEDYIRGFRHRSGSLESQSQLLHSHCANKSAFPLSPSRRSNSTEVLEDCSSYTSMSSMDYCLPCSATPPYRMLDSPSHDYRLHRKVEIYGNTGSMPNLVPQNSSCYGHQQNHYSPTAYYVTGYPGFEYEPCSNGAYVYESELEGHYNINPTYPAHGYQSRSRNRHYGIEGSDNLSQNPYATVRPPRGRQGPLNEVLTKNMYKALVAEHLKGWYNRSAGHREPGAYQLVYTYKYDRGSQHSLGYQTLPAPFTHSSRTNSFSSGRFLKHNTMYKINHIDPLSCKVYFQPASAHLACDFSSDPVDPD